MRYEDLLEYKQRLYGAKNRNMGEFRTLIEFNDNPIKKFYRKLKRMLSRKLFFGNNKRNRRSNNKKRSNNKRNSNNKNRRRSNKKHRKSKI